MAFSFRIGTKWCHDFPKLAKESGFYFNMHRSRVRVDWNRISTIDIDRIIRERDFHSIDDNINNVIDYCLESEYDVKILDPNFVKLFCLAQLAVEYLLYCKQYLDHSVMILKNELRLKIEENVKLKKEIATLEEVVKHIKQKAKERSKLIETKIGDTNGEVYKCPHCPKTFISPMYVSAHIIRRHAYASDLYMTASPIHEHYRNETEKLHNEIKNLKERLNETEKVIKNESEKIPEKKILEYDKRQVENEIESLKYSNNKCKEYSEYKGYQEEIKNLRTMLFDEIHNLKQREKTMYEYTSETNVQALINQQEKEFQKLKNQLFEKLTPDIENMHAKLYAQENYWKSKIEQLENQHHKDVERLTTELKLTQNTADDMKTKYETKVSDLERQTANQSNILIEQSKQLHSLTHEINVSQLNEKNEDVENNSSRMYSSSNIIGNDIINTTSSNLSSKIFPLAIESQFLKNIYTTNSKNKSVICNDQKSIKQRNTKCANNIDFDYIKNDKKDLKYDSSSSSDLEGSILEKRDNYKPTKHNYSITKSDLNESGISKLKNTFNNSMSDEFLSNIKNTQTLESLEDNLSSETNSGSFISDSNTESVTTVHNSPLHKNKTHSPCSSKYKRTTEHGSFHKKLQSSIKDAFEQKLRDLGIDPEWQGIPKATFKQKMNILKHHHKLTAKKSPKYHQIKLKIIEEILDKISRKGKSTENIKQLKKLPLHRPITNVQSIKKLSNQQDSDYHTSTLQEMASNKFHSTPKIKDLIEDIVENESIPTKIKKTSNFETIEKLVQMSPNVTKSSESIQHTKKPQESQIGRDSLDKIKPLLGSETIISKDKVVLSNKPIENNSIDNSNIQQELQNIFVSPKHNKSVLKSTSGSTSSLTKKKVIFDLTNKESRESYSDDDKTEIGNKELNKDNWETSSISNEKKHLPQSEDYKSSNNIILKTAQSDKIAEISKKLEAQLNMVRQKPVGSIETIFSSKYLQNKENQNNSNEQINSTTIGPLLISPLQMSISNSKKTSDFLPQPAPRNLTNKMSEILHTESISEISDLDSDIDKILKLD